MSAGQVFKYTLENRGVIIDMENTDKQDDLFQDLRKQEEI